MQFSLVPPGARSLAMGSAFVGFANDASSAWTNPAGLMSLSTPEVSLEFRHVGSQEGSEKYSTLETPRTTTVDFSYSSSDSVSFASYVYPKEKFAFGFFYQELALQDASGSVTGSRVGVGPEASPNYDSISDFELSIPGIGASAAMKFGDHVSLGASLAYYGIDFESSFNSQRVFVSNHVRISQETTRVVSSDEKAFGGVVGALWANDTLRLGAVYRFGPKFDARSTRTCTHNIPNPNSTPDGGDCAANNQAVLEVKSTSFPVPDSYGIGFAWQATDTFSVGVDVIQTEYSDLADLAYGTAGNKRIRTFEIEDALEPHLGMEWALKLKAERYLYLRGGTWLEADHRLLYKRPANNPSAVFDKLYPSEAEDSELHATVGVGYVAGAKWQVDLAGDFSGWSDIASLSFVYRF